jgi:hypothetical protein
MNIKRALRFYAMRLRALELEIASAKEHRLAMTDDTNLMPRAEDRAEEHEVDKMIAYFNCPDL